MVRDIAAHETGPLIIDAIATQGGFLEGLTDTGWSIERPFQRMRFGRASNQPAKTICPPRHSWRAIDRN